MSSEPLPAATEAILILGGGIHGAALARELVLNGVPVVLADAGDLAGGATSKSSRLIHGGLRYLEFGDVGLVRESLIERGRLLKLAPQFVRPLRLFVPTEHRWSGLLRSALGFFKLARTRFGRRLMGRAERRAPRGYWPIRMGLWMYDLFSWGDGLPKSRGMRLESTSSETPRPNLDSSRYRWLCAYSDAQMLYPERCVVALLDDAAQVSHDSGVPLHIVPYATVGWQGTTIQVKGVGNSADLSLAPPMVINCSGAWGDLTLREIDAGTTPLFAGTKGSHFVTRHPGLKAALGSQGVYAETGDRRLAFILPYADAILVGTTDEEWSGPPDEAVASDEELQYLLGVVDGTFGLKLTRADIESHYSGVRPLPRTTDTSNAAISRDHTIVEHNLHGVPVLTLVGGKLTTFRSVARQIADRVLAKLSRRRTSTTDDRVLPGGEGFPVDAAGWPGLWQSWAGEFNVSVEEAAALWPLFGMRTREILAQSTVPRRLIADSVLSRSTVCWVIENEWVTTLDDLIERRLMLIFAAQLSIAMIEDLAECLVQTDRLSQEQIPATVEATVARLQRHYGRTIPAVISNPA
ncbi:MAG: glycerol-3-phosphate dehydrogenase/oxidase [Planctomycetes bacterium]|nr:glycerol-3-phosphate dehydrogenase/oxidase [Planctomycetota bacterium]